MVFAVKSNSRILIAALVVITVWGCALMFNVSSRQNHLTPWYKVVHCTTDCQFSKDDLLRVSGAPAQNLQMGVTLASCSAKNLWDPLGRQSISIAPGPSGVSLVELPYFTGGENQLMGIPLPNLKKRCYVEVELQQSREFLIYVNHQFFYGMRYNEPIFHLSTWSTVNTDTREGIGQISIQGVISPSGFERSWSFYIVLIAMIICFTATLALTRPLVVRKSSLSQSCEERRDVE